MSATGLGVEGSDHAQAGEQLGVRLTLPDGTTVVATTSVVRIAGPVTALKIESFEEGSRDRLSDYVLACARGDAVGSSDAPGDFTTNPS